MRRSSNLGRRDFLKALSAGAGALGASRLGLREAYAAPPERSALVVLWLDGGYNALFSSADSFRNTAFSVNDGNIADLGNGLVVDKGTLGALPAFATSHMASIGIRHGMSAHEAAQPAHWAGGQGNYAIQLASAMGGDGAIKCAQLGAEISFRAAKPAVNGVSFQRIDSLDSTIRALGGGAPDPKTPARNVASKGLVRARSMSSTAMTRNPTAMVSFKNGFDTGIQVLEKPIKPFVYDEIARAYTGQATGNPMTIIDQSPGAIRFTPADVANVKTQFVGAELMIRAGANVVTINHHGWDTHGDSSGSFVRDTFSKMFMSPLTTFINRMTTEPELQAMNIVVAIVGEFARSLPGSDHQANGTATVIGKYVKGGTTGRTDRGVGLPPGTPSIPQFWAYLSKALRVPTDPFGANPHNLIL